MIERLEIQNFRGFRQLVLDDLRRINLLIGGNDTGKTSVLEALVLLLGDGAAVSNLPVTFRANQYEGGRKTSVGGPAVNPDDYENFWLWLFYDRNPENAVTITAKIHSGSTVVVAAQMRDVRGDMGGRLGTRKVLALERTLPGGPTEQIAQFQQHNVNTSGNFVQGLRVSHLSVRPSNPVQDAELYNQVALEADGERRIENVMREIEPRLRRLRYAKLPGTSPLVYADIAGLRRAVPSTQMGQAFNRILHIYTEILAADVNVLLVDEIENGIFSETLSTIWKGLLAICEQEDVQIFATTHSRECVIAAHTVADQLGKNDLCVQRLQRVKGEVEAVRLGSKQLELATEMGLEVRS